jgi:hypothetical protein
MAGGEMKQHLAGMGRLRLIALALLIALGALSACSLIGGENVPGRLSYSLPTTITVAKGKAVPGTDIVYEGMGNDAATMLIKGQRALKRKGDSLDWSGNQAAGVAVKLTLRVAWVSEQEVNLVGVAKITIDGVNPQAGAISTLPTVKYAGPVAYSVNKGQQIPGSTVSYIGHSDEGAQLGGIQDYPYRKGGDSIIWEGTLRQGVSIRLELRVAQYDDKALRLAGLATLWIGS